MITVKFKFIGDTIDGMLIFKLTVITVAFESYSLEV